MTPPSKRVLIGAAALEARVAELGRRLGEDYAGYYPAEDTDALARLLQRGEDDPASLKRLAAQIRKRQPLFRPERERAAWRRLLAEIRRGS